MEDQAFVPEGLYMFEDEDLIMSQLLADYCSVSSNDLNYQASSSQVSFANFPSSHECSTAKDMEGIANLYSRRIMATNYHNPEAFHPWDANSTTNSFFSQSEENAGMDQVMRNCNVGDHEVVSENSKKRPCSTSVDDVQKNKRNVKSKMTNQKPVLTRNIADSCSSGDDEPMNANPQQDLSPNARSSRELAIDPQRTYAKKRRDKINSRLRILQNLVPNGTKVDISTMLEETVEYVKFLQLQIKLLSSDELWMYAPVVNNGIGIGVQDLL
ncbi:PREDICTED: transcription factor bHLH54-like [Fragaria vesca subsp. vesca]|uniref:transcription factor bHLH54-like n=1 Tax=Fragaria vesca subsp. vesca TaxID=101020 RepID=UPI0002C30FBE|nr:PREDICTED: transcription factor bHLH54-like [Fragaria vesca subsp. vesca]